MPRRVLPSRAELRKLTSAGTAIAQQLNRASASYGEMASRSRTRATVGSFATLLSLLAAFLLVYRRSVRARRTAEALVAENERLLQVSRDDATTDALTGLRNRRALNDDFEEMLSGATHESELMLAMFDLDGFKSYNDTFGHGPGDDLLAALGGRLGEAMGGRASSYRMGGDEFCILAKAGPVDADFLVNHAAVALSDFDGRAAVACSYGVVWVLSEAHDMSTALRLADERMYAHKQARSAYRLGLPERVGRLRDETLAR